MKALIFSVSAGGGHKRAAEAVKSYIDIYDNNSEVKIIDTIRYINPLIDKVVIGGYLKTIKLSPNLFGKLYDYSESDYGIANLSAKINEILTYKLIPLIDEFKPDILISTHAFTTEMISIIKMKHKKNLPTVSVITDYACHSFWLHPYIDAYIVSNSDMANEMVSKGIDRDTIYNIGIPIKPEFFKKYDSAKTLEDIGLFPNKKTILIMGGSLGIGKIENIYKKLLFLDKDIQIIIVTGRNKRLYDELIKIRDNFQTKPTYIIGFTDNVNKYMQACDLLISKPGGLTVTEALICGVPLAIFSPIPGQEEKNAEFLLKYNLAINLSESKNCIDAIDYLISNEAKLQEMKDNCREFSNPHVGENLYDILKSLLDKSSLK
ncbi:MAG: UDP-N-acetylglucosamine--LPS N-acetylglucosamine transferase [Clostridium lundense]|nr:UDP-N-acetylglucosamine--LPS N-acetylglucosamine transferase [Clostridium lundense]